MNYTSKNPECHMINIQTHAFLKIKCLNLRFVFRAINTIASCRVLLLSADT